MMFTFFFSSRRRHTRYIGDWSSDVCSSDLDRGARLGPLGDNETHVTTLETKGAAHYNRSSHEPWIRIVRTDRSEERRVGKECTSRWTHHKLKEKVNEKGTMPI